MNVLSHFSGTKVNNANNLAMYCWFTRPLTHPIALEGWRIALLITCRTFEDLFGDVLKNLERSKRLLYTSADIAHFHEAQEARISFQEEFRRHQAIQEEQRKFRVLDWLSPTNVTNQHHDLQNRRSRFPKTTKWIFNEPVWKEWLLSYQASNHLFWLSGIPGAGMLYGLNILHHLHPTSLTNCFSYR